MTKMTSKYIKKLRKLICALENAIFLIYIDGYINYSYTHKK